MRLRTNKGAVLNASDYLTVGDYMFAVSLTQSYGYCLVLMSDSDMQFWYGTPPNPALGLGPTFMYTSILQDLGSTVYKDPGFKPGQAASYFAVMQGDGNFCIYKGTSPADNQGFCWSTNTYGKGAPPYAAVLGADGNVRVGGSLQSGSVTPTWQTSMSWPGQRVVTGDRLSANATIGTWLSFNDTLVAGQSGSGSGYPYMAWMQASDVALACNTPPGRPLVLPPGSPGGSGTQVYWSCVTNRPGNIVGRNAGGAMYATMQPDGNFVIYNGSDPGHRGGAYWATSTARSNGNYVAQLQADGSLSVGPAGSPYWSSLQGTTLQINVVYGNSQTVTVHGGYDVIPYPDPMTVRVTTPAGVPAGGASVTFVNYASTEGLVTVYFAAEPMEENTYTTVATDSNGYATVRMWGQSGLGGPDQPGSVMLEMDAAAAGGYPGITDRNQAIQYVSMAGQ
jgi:hypothetical protein